MHVKISKCLEHHGGHIVHTPFQPRARSRLHHTLWIAAFVTLAAAVAYIRAIYKDIREAVAPMAYAIIGTVYCPV